MLPSETKRTAIARAVVELNAHTLELLKAKALPKGDVLTVAQVAGIMAAKRTSELIPMCHPLAITHADVRFRVQDEPPSVLLEASASTTGRTGVEMEAIKRIFGANGELAINSTKALTGHMIGAAGAVEAIFCSLMMEHSFVCESANLKEPEEEFAWADIVRKNREGVKISHSLSNSFGFGGTNASLVFSRAD